MLEINAQVNKYNIKQKINFGKLISNLRVIDLRVVGAVGEYKWK